MKLFIHHPIQLSFRISPSKLQHFISCIFYILPFLLSSDLGIAIFFISVFRSQRVGCCCCPAYFTAFLPCLMWVLVCCTATGKLSYWTREWKCDLCDLLPVKNLNFKFLMFAENTIVQSALTNQRLNNQVVNLLVDCHVLTCFRAVWINQRF